MSLFFRMALLLALVAAACGPSGKRGPRTDDERPLPVGPVVSPPMLVPPRSPSPSELISLQGYATAGHRVEVYINGVMQGETVTRADGVFEFRGLMLQPGPTGNRITAVAIDDRGNRSEDRPAGGGARTGTGGALKREVFVEVRP